MSDRFQQLALFVRVAETGSFSRAGRELGLPQPTVSRVIGALEARLGVKLLLRTTRKVTPTEAGAALLQRARIVLSELEEAEGAARGTDSFTGVLRVATPVTFGAREIAPRLGPFLEAHPALHIELLMADRRVDLLEEGVDLAIRLGPLDDSSFVSRRLASAPALPRRQPGLSGAPRRPGLAGGAAGARHHPRARARHACLEAATSRRRRDLDQADRPHGGDIDGRRPGGSRRPASGSRPLPCSHAEPSLRRGELFACCPSTCSPIDVHAVFPAPAASRQPRRERSLSILRPVLFGAIGLMTGA
jgi:DNA-binding transcriptional LysR family regulator